MSFTLMLCLEWIINLTFILDVFGLRRKLEKHTHRTIINYGWLVDQCYECCAPPPHPPTLLTALLWPWFQFSTMKMRTSCPTQTSISSTRPWWVQGSEPSPDPGPQVLRSSNVSTPLCLQVEKLLENYMQEVGISEQQFLDACTSPFAKSKSLQVETFHSRVPPDTSATTTWKSDHDGIHTHNPEVYPLPVFWGQWRLSG